MSNALYLYYLLSTEDRQICTLINFVCLFVCLFVCFVCSLLRVLMGPDSNKILKQGFKSQSIKYAGLRYVEIKEVKGSRREDRKTTVIRNKSSCTILLAAYSQESQRMGQENGKSSCNLNCRYGTSFS